ncbi:MAG: hypothetical protein J3R72DRAFT_438779 [Linnemannia gamsii]|nr:MAG: hypothetical protein J3R72DRAFT_438779 [Linnemannia gamsii]
METAFFFFYFFSFYVQVLFVRAYKKKSTFLLFCHIQRPCKQNARRGTGKQNTHSLTHNSNKELANRGEVHLKWAWI